MVKDLTDKQRKFLKDLRKMSSASDEDVQEIYILYRILIDDPKVLKEWEECKCSSIIRTMGFELVLFYLKNKKEINGK